MGAGHIRIKGPFPPPNPLLYPSGRKTASHVYHIYNGAGGKIMSGTNGPDTAETVAYAKRRAAEKGWPNATVEIIPA
jgi:hypothetical protein